MFMTIFCDASVCGETQAAGWGAWAKQDGWPSGIIFGGQFKDTMKSSGEAELCAIANTLHKLAAGSSLDGVREIMVQSDSVHALGRILKAVPGCWNQPHAKSAYVSQNMSGKGSKRERDAVDVIDKIIRTRRIKLTVRHVKGHAHDGSRSWVNRQCDKEAKKHMRDAREKRKQANARQEPAGCPSPTGHAEA